MQPGNSNTCWRCSGGDPNIDSLCYECQGDLYEDDRVEGCSCPVCGELRTLRKVLIGVSWVGKRVEKQGDVCLYSEHSEHICTGCVMWLTDVVIVAKHPMLIQT